MDRRHSLQFAAFLGAGAKSAWGQDAGQATPSEQFSFALLGCVGYRPPEEPLLKNLFDDMNSHPLSFVVHLGDLATPTIACTDELLARRLEQFRASKHPVIYTPGDNEWTDCHGETLPELKGKDPIERLGAIRNMFFRGEESLGRRVISLTRQSQSKDPHFAKYRENVRWSVGGVIFVTLHNTGSNNGLGRSAEGDSEYAERNKANLDWLKLAFEAAQASNSRAVMILQQANIFPEQQPSAGTPSKDPHAFTEIRTLLERETVAFGKPVILAHSDSHFFRVDKPLGPQRAQREPGQQRQASPPALENFTRVETFGSPNVHWVQVKVDARDPNVFSFHPRIVTANVYKR